MIGGAVEKVGAITAGAVEKVGAVTDGAVEKVGAITGGVVEKVGAVPDNTAGERVDEGAGRVEAIRDEAVEEVVAGGSSMRLLIRV